MYGMSAREFRRFWWRYIAGAGMWAVLTFCVTQLGPAWSAHLGHGQMGTWTVTRLACSRGSCNDVGRFVSIDGGVRSEVGISGGASLGVGESLAAVDTGGDTVYPPGGGSAWLKITIATSLLVVVCAVWTWTFPVAVFRRRLAARQSPMFGTTTFKRRPTAH